MRIQELANDLDLAEERAHILKGLSNPCRLRIVAHLAGLKESSVGDICESLGLPQAKVSQQLSSLRLLGLVQLRKDAGYHYYSLAIPQLKELLGCLARSCRVESTA